VTAAEDTKAEEKSEGMSKVDDDSKFVQTRLDPRRFNPRQSQFTFGN